MPLGQASPHNGAGNKQPGGLKMLSVETPQDLKNHVGADCGASDWVTVDQEMINKFADATGDHQWIHVDVERAKTEMPNGQTIAHGFLTLSLVPLLSAQTLTVNKRSRGINYGSNKVRFTNMVRVGQAGAPAREAGVGGAQVRRAADDR